MYETDPINLQPKIHPLNITVANLIRKNIPYDVSQDKVDLALEILESPWPRRDEKKLKEWFQNEIKSSKFIVEKVLASGLEPYKTQQPLPPIQKEDIELLVWMGIYKKNFNLFD